MPALHPPICDFDWPAPAFTLPGVDGKTHSLQDVRGSKGTLIMFICNHCPYVQTAIGRIVADAKHLAGLGIGVAAVMSNDVQNYPQDGFEPMKDFAAANALPFPYLLDESQEVARAYNAICTPDFYGFNADLGLQYRGRLDGGTPGNIHPDGKRELLEAMTMIAQTHKGPTEQTPSIGCSIKWAG